ncbi:MAG TPA: hypothetical protein VHB79_21105 [Polyangiaceae bacterium]|nr:hypothetical protein [Polyangiaceae bacterium]
MKRAVWLLVVAFAAWLLALPASALAARRAAVTQVAAHAHVASSIEALPSAVEAVRVAPAPQLARLPAVLPVLRRSCVKWPRLLEAAPRDARRELSRVQVRRAVPRLNDAEPPWASAR